MIPLHHLVDYLDLYRALLQSNRIFAAELFSYYWLAAFVPGSKADRFFLPRPTNPAEVETDATTSWSILGRRLSNCLPLVRLKLLVHPTLRSNTGGYH